MSGSDRRDPRHRLGIVRRDSARALSDVFIEETLIAFVDGDVYAGLALTGTLDEPLWMRDGERSQTRSMPTSTRCSA